MVLGGVVECHADVDAFGAGRDPDIGGQRARCRGVRPPRVSIGVEANRNCKGALDVQGLNAARVSSALYRDRCRICDGRPEGVGVVAVAAVATVLYGDEPSPCSRSQP